jgi:hypothetical protein
MVIKVNLIPTARWIWVLRYRVNGAEQTPLVLGLVDDFPTEDEASLEADRLGLRVRINCGVPQGGRMKYWTLKTPWKLRTKEQGGFAKSNSCTSRSSLNPRNNWLLIPGTVWFGFP